MKKKNYFFNFKGFSKVCLVSATLFLSASAFAQDLTTGLIMHYDFDAISGTNVPDISGTGNVGTLMGTALDTVGYSGNGVKMMVKDAYITIPADITASLNSFTFSTWVNFSALKKNTRFFDFGIEPSIISPASPVNDFLAFIPSYDNDNSFMRLRFRPATGTSYNVNSTVKCPVGAWAHIALTYEWDATASAGTAKIYLNGAVVGTGTIPGFNPSLLGSTPFNYLGYSRWSQDTNGLNGTIDDVRLYNRALTAADIVTMNGMAELNNQFEALTLGDISGLTENKPLPTTAGTNGVTIRWASSKPAVMDSLGNVTRPAVYDATVTLTATLSQVVGGKKYSMTKIFTAKVLGITGTPEQIAEWNFTSENISMTNDTLRVKDIQSGFEGKLVNDARIRTIGTSTKYNVLDLGNGTGYFDMGTDIGKAVYSLSDYSIMGYYRVDESYTALANSGNFLYAFSNTAFADVDRNGYVIGRLNNTSHQCTSGYWGIGKMEVAANTVTPQGTWHHYAYTQNGTTGTIYIDGAVAATGSMTNLPSTHIALADRSGTLFNWLGRSVGLSSDVFLRKTLVYDFQLLSFSLSADDIYNGFTGFEGVTTMLGKLNSAYTENPDYTAPELITEKDQLTLGDLSAVTTNIVLPKTGTLDPTITISWKTTNSKLIDVNGVVTRPDYYNYNDTLTAVLTKNGQSTSKAFPATVLLKEGTAFTNNLLVKYDFSSVADSVVTDVAEKHFTGTLKNNAKVTSIGSSVKYNVLSLGDSIGYFDMGSEVGKLMYNLSDYTMSAYYRIDTAYTELSNAGNFLWTFSNSANSGTAQNGYVIGALNTQSVNITPKYYTAASGNQFVSLATPAFQGGWHNLTYSQSGTTGVLYVDGWPMATDTITNLPSTTLPKPGMLGTLYNWIGRSNFTSDVYLRKTLVYDFRLYKTVLTDEQIQSSVLNVENTISALNTAYNEAPNAVKTLQNKKYNVISTVGAIKILGLTGAEKIAVYDIAGRQLRVNNPWLINANSGVYIVRINNEVTKVIVK